MASCKSSSASRPGIQSDGAAASSLACLYPLRMASFGLHYATADAQGGRRHENMAILASVAENTGHRMGDWLAGLSIRRQKILIAADWAFWGGVLDCSGIAIFLLSVGGRDVARCAAGRSKVCTSPRVRHHKWDSEH
jgi:hypothetical protein